MRFFFTLALFAIAIPFAFSAENQNLATNTLSLPDQALLEIIAPKEWTFVSKGRQVPDLAIPRTAELSSEKEGMKLLITVFWDGFGTGKKTLTAADYEGIVKKSLEDQYVPTSVEKKTVIEKFKGTNAHGWFARFTDSTWVRKTPPPNEFAHVAAGWFQCGDVWGNFTLLTNEKDGPRFKRGMAVLESLKKSPAKP